MSGQAHLQARPGTITAEGSIGLQKLGLGGKRDSYLFVPAQYTASQPLPLVLLLHGAGGHAHDGLRVLLHLADDNKLILVAPASTASTWDIIASRSYGADRRLADKALSHVFAHYAIDERHLGIGGFSDGASYALSLGLANGDLFTHILAFSPGFVGPVQPRGNPEVFVSHGRADAVLPIDPCSRTIVRQLRAGNYRVTYDEFDDGHAIPPEVAAHAVSWFLGNAPGAGPDN